MSICLRGLLRVSPQDSSHHCNELLEAFHLLSAVVVVRERGEAAARFSFLALTPALVASKTRWEVGEVASMRKPSPSSHKVHNEISYVAQPASTWRCRPL